jgi:hypothetical protein
VASKFFPLDNYSTKSLNKFSVFLLTSVPTSFSQSVDFAEGHFFGRFAEPNFPGNYHYFIGALNSMIHHHLLKKGNPSPKNVAPATLTMPDFSKSPGGWGTGMSDSNKDFALIVMEEYATGTVRLQ